jgi:hypothetical protein
MLTSFEDAACGITRPTIVADRSVSESEIKGCLVDADVSYQISLYSMVYMWNDQGCPNGAAV